ncbi:ankyrin repeat domain-containing protein [bacterium]|nr:ankyrin repeat domain-containing protein [bacterium]
MFGKDYSLNGGIWGRGDEAAEQLEKFAKDLRKESPDYVKVSTSTSSDYSIYEGDVSLSYEGILQIINQKQAEITRALEETKKAETIQKAKFAIYHAIDDGNITALNSSISAMRELDANFVNSLQTKDECPLIYALGSTSLGAEKASNIEIISFLLDNKFNPEHEITNINGTTNAFLEACKYADVYTVGLLYSIINPNLEKTGYRGETALHSAVSKVPETRSIPGYLNLNDRTNTEFGKEEQLERLLVVGLLIKESIKQNINIETIKDAQGKTPLDLAKPQVKSTVEMLIAKLQNKSAEELAQLEDKVRNDCQEWQERRRCNLQPYCPTGQ